MPWHVSRSMECPSGRRWAVLRDIDNEVVGCHGTRAEAEAHMAALYANVDEAMRARAKPKPDEHDT